MNRRNAIGNIGLAAAAGAMGFPKDTFAEEQEKLLNGLPPLIITNIKAIATQPYGIELVVVKVETNEPGLYGVGCATFRQRAHTVVSAINDYLAPFCVGKNADNIEDLWQMTYQNSYWRNGPVLNNAVSGLDQALWDIKGKRAGMPVYQLLGGKCKFAVDTYAHAGAGTKEEVAKNVKAYMEQGYRHVRIQLGGYGSTALSDMPDFKKNGFGLETDNFYNPAIYLKETPKLFEYVRKECGDAIELLHDVHERVQPMDAINLCKRVEEYRPFFIEDPFSPENMGWFELLRKQTSVPIAMGELFNNPHEWIEPISKRWYDFIRAHISQIGGITPAMKLARLGEWYNVKTAWHGPGDTSPVGHAANAHIDLAVWNFGIQEAAKVIRTPDEKVQAIFPGMPYVKNGFMFVNEAPGLGVDINEKEAAKYPLQKVQLNNWTQLRSNDGKPVRP